MDDHQGTQSGEWGRKDATLSDTTAQKEYGLTRAEILEAIQVGQLQYREGSARGGRLPVTWGLAAFPSSSS